VVPPTLGSGPIELDFANMNIVGGKSEDRCEYRKKRDRYLAGLSDQDVSLAFSAVPSPLRSLFSPDKIVAAYIPIESEANPQALLKFAHEAGCKTALPHVTSMTAPMRFLQWQLGDVLEDGPFGLKQPKADAAVISPDIILVPLVAFDRSLNRLGQGAGHYDRALSLLEDAYTVGIAWSVQEAPYLAADPWDMPLDAILTEKEWISR
jgi:5-formyltetrahydrofolate cyclo-ligase